MNGRTETTIATIGDAGYLWGIFLLVASARKAGMPERFLVGSKGFGEKERRVLEQLGGVDVLPLDGVARSLTCLKAHVMLQARTDTVAWADSDGFFTGNVSDLLPPDTPEEIHFRLRTAPEMPAAFRGRRLREGGGTPQDVLDAWRRDVAAVAGGALEEARYRTAGSAAFFALSIARHRRFLEIWDALQTRVLPERDVGVVDTSLEFYHQLDESTLNACLDFVPDAPRVQREFKMNKDRGRLYAHFIGRPKPWTAWTRRSFRHFDAYVAVAAWAAASGLELPGPMPACLRTENKRRCGLLAPWNTLKPKLARRLGKWLG